MNSSSREEKSENKFGIDLPTIVLAIIMLIIPITFLYMLSISSTALFSPGYEPKFGVSEILFSVAFAILAVLFLRWIKIIIRKNPYLGLIAGIVILSVFEYALFFRFKGPNTIIFAIVTGVVILIYLGIFFFTNRNGKN